MKTKIGDAMIDVLADKAKDEPTIGPTSLVGWGDVLLFDAFTRAGARVKIPHPLNVMKAVLDSLDRDERFKKFYINIYGKRCRIFRQITDQPSDS